MSRPAIKILIVPTDNFVNSAGRYRAEQSLQNKKPPLFLESGLTAICPLPL